MKRLIFCCLSLLLVACASTSPPEEITQVPDNDISLAEVSRDYERFNQLPIRWGGRIVKATQESESTLSPLILEILEYPLDDKGTPDQTIASNGRFIAKLKPPYKLKNYQRNRVLTVVGRLVGQESTELANGQMQVLPVVEIQEQYTWKKTDRDREQESVWSRFFFRIGVGVSSGSRNAGVGVGVVFH